MNIADLLNINNPTKNQTSHKAQLKLEGKKYEKRMNDIISNVFDFISYELSHINREFYDYGDSFSESEKDELRKKLKQVCYQLPDKLRKSLDEVFSEDSDKEDSSKEETKEQVETKIITPQTIHQSMFEY